MAQTTAMPTTEAEQQQQEVHKQETGLTVEIVELQKRRTLARTAYIFPSKLGEHFSDSFKIILEHMKKTGVEMEGYPYARYHMYTYFLVHAEAGVEVKDTGDELKGDDSKGITVSELPECKAAATWHLGPYQTLGDTYMALCAWIKGKGMWPGRLCFEEYHTDPEKETDKSKYKTRVYWSLSETFVSSLFG